MADFGTLNLDDMMGEDARLSEQGGKGNFLDQFVPMPEVRPGQTGSVAVRVLPPVRGGKLFQYNRVHTLNGRKVHCPRPLIKTEKGMVWDRNVKCPICDYYSGLWQKIDKIEKAKGKDCPEAKAMKQEARDIKPVERYYYNAIVRSMLVNGKEQKNVGPRILSVGKVLHQVIVTAIVGRKDDPESKLGNITDLKAGWDFIIRKTVTPGDEGFPKYDGSGFARNQSAAGEPSEIKEWQEKLHDLTKLRNPRDFEHLDKELAIHRGFIADDTEAFDMEGHESRWRQQGQQEAAAAVRTATSVSVPAGVPSAAPTGPETMSLDDKAFVEELAQFDLDK